MEETYFDNARRAFNDGNDKACWVYLKKSELLGRESVSLLVNCVYRIWQNTQTKAEHESQVIMKKKEILDIVDTGFSTILGMDKLSHKYIEPLDYIRLANIYICEGSIVGASKIIQLASARGYLEHCGIVLMRWLLNKQIGYEAEAVCSIDFLCSKMVLQDSSPPDNTGIAYLPGTDLNIAYMYLHCAAHVYEEVMAAPKGKKSMGYNRDSFDYFVLEAFKLCTGAHEDNLFEAMCWYADYKTWFQMGVALENTAFSLLAEESYFESFIRAPLREEALTFYLDCIIRRKAETHLYTFLAKALELFPLNLYGRAYIRELESRPTFMKYAVWTALFKYQDCMATVIQSLGRRYLIRIHWEEIRQRQVRRLKYFKIGVKKALQREAEIVEQRRRDAFTGWANVTFTSNGERYTAVMKIQRHVRRRQAMRWYRGALARVARANRMFLQLAENNILYTEQGLFRFWHALAIKERKRRSALVLIHTLGRSLIVDDYKKKKRIYIAVGMRRRRLAILHLFEEWKRRYSTIQQIRGMAIVRQVIRLFMIRRRAGLTTSSVAAAATATSDLTSPARPASSRSSRGASRGASRGSTRRQIKEKLAKQAADDAAAKEAARKKLETEFMEVSEQAETVHQRMLAAQVSVRLTSTWWRCWLRALKIRAIHYARCKVARLLPRLLARRRGRDTVTLHRVRYECQNTCQKILWCRRVRDVFRRWRGTYIVMNFQRIVNNLISRIRWKESVQSSVDLERLHDHITWNLKRTMFSFLVIGLKVQKREYNSASKKISRLFRKLFIRKAISHICRRKVWQGKLLDSLHRALLRHGFASFRSESRPPKLRVEGSKAIVRSVRKAFLRLIWTTWRRNTTHQSIIRHLHELLIARRIAKRFGANHVASTAVYGTHKDAEQRVAGLRDARELFSRWYSRPDSKHSMRSSSVRASTAAVAEITSPTRSAIIVNDGNNWYIEVPQKPSLVTIDTFDVSRAFRAWMVSYLLKKESRHSDHVSQDASMFFYAVVHRVMLRQTCAVTVQCCLRRFLAITRMRELRVNSRQEDEAKEVVRKRKLRQVFLYGCSLAARKVKARKTLFRFMDLFMNRLRLKKRRVKLRRVAEKVYRWERDMTDSRQKIVKSVFNKMILLFYAQKLQWLISADHSSFSLENDEDRLRNLRLTQSLEYGVSKLVELPARKLFSSLDGPVDDDYCLASSALPQRLSRRSPADAAVYEFTQTGTVLTSSSSSARTPPSRKARSRSALGHSFDPVQWLAEDSRKSPALSTRRLQPLTKDFESTEYHSASFRLRETGCFFLDISNIKLTRLEVEKCLSEAEVLICSYPTTRCMSDIIRHFRGSKITLVGGTLTAKDIRSFSNYLRARTNDISVDIAESKIPTAAARFQLIYDMLLSPDSDVGVAVASPSPVRIERAKVNPFPPPINLDQVGEQGGKLVPIEVVDKSTERKVPLFRGIRSLKKLSLDASTMGSLPMMVLITAIQYNSFVETLYLTIGETFLAPGLDSCLRQLAPNETLKEFRISGCHLGPEALGGVLYAVENGLSALERLDIVAAADEVSVQVSSRIIEVARTRNQRSISSDATTSFNGRIAFLSINFI